MSWALHATGRLRGTGTRGWRQGGDCAGWTPRVAALPSEAEKRSEVCVRVWPVSRPHLVIYKLPVHMVLWYWLGLGSRSPSQGVN